MQQLEMFPEDIRIERVDAETNMYRFYRLRLMPDLFGGVSLLREWGRIGTQDGTGSSCSLMPGVPLTQCFSSIAQSRNAAIILPRDLHQICNPLGA